MKVTRTGKRILKPSSDFKPKSAKMDSNWINVNKCTRFIWTDLNIGYIRVDYLIILN